MVGQTLCIHVSETVCTCSQSDDHSMDLPRASPTMRRTRRPQRLTIWASNVQIGVGIREAFAIRRHRSICRCPGVRR